MTRTLSMLFAWIAMAAPLIGCSGDGGTGSGGGGAAAATSSGDSSSNSGASSSESSGSGGVEGGPELRVIKQFPGGVTSLELPDGLAITPDGKTAYVGIAPTGKILKVSLPDGNTEDFGGLALPPQPTGLMLGLILDTSGNLFAAVTGALAGVYKIDKNGGTATLFVSDLSMPSPNGFGFLSDGSLLVTDSAAGKIFRIDLKSKQLAPWTSDPLLQGNPSTGTNKCAEGLPGTAEGANGITSIGNHVYVANTDSAKLLRIPINFDGTAGQVEELLKSDPTSCAPLQGIDGLTADEVGNLYFVGSSINTLSRIDKDSSNVTTLVPNDARLDFPATVVLSTLDGKRYAYLTSLALMSRMKPGLLAYGPLP